jgi:hypothetical protein
MAMFLASSRFISSFPLKIMESIPSITIDSKIALRSGFSVPQLGLGVYQNKGESAVTACLAAFEAGYRHVDSAQLYRNEAGEVSFVDMASH